MLALAVLFVVGCHRGKNTDDVVESSLDSHRETVAKFQDGQQRFKDLIATVRDEKSFDAARADLDAVVSDWREAAIALRRLKPPSEGEQANFRKLIADGNRRTEPTGEDLISLISIESREAEVTQWLEEFTAAAEEAGTEMLRLYGPTGYTGPEAEGTELDPSTATNPSPIGSASKAPPPTIITVG